MNMKRGFTSLGWDAIVIIIIVLVVIILGAIIIGRNVTEGSNVLDLFSFM